MKKLYIIIILFTASICYAQYPLRNYMFEQNKFIINPAYAGETEKTRISLTSLLIPGNIDNSSTYFIQGINLDFNVSSLNHNLATGTRMSYVNQEIFTDFTIDQSLAYKLSLDENQLLSFGISIGINRISTNLRGGNGGNVHVDKDDPLLKSGIDTENNLRMEFGTLYKNRNIEFSISMPYLLDYEGVHLGLNSYLGYTFGNNLDFKFTPSLLLIKTSANNYSLTGSINIVYREKFWGQLNLTDFNNQAVIGFGMKFKIISIGYNFGKPLTSNLSSEVLHQLGFFVNF